MLRSSFSHFDAKGVRSAAAGRQRRGAGGRRALTPVVKKVYFDRAGLCEALLSWHGNHAPVTLSAIARSFVARCHIQTGERFGPTLPVDRVIQAATPAILFIGNCVGGGGGDKAAHIMDALQAPGIAGDGPAPMSCPTCTGCGFAWRIA